MNFKNFEGKSVLITGASSGIGAALAERFSKISAIHLILCGRNQKRLENTAKICRNQGAAVETLIFDVTDEVATNEAIQKAAKSCKIDILIANAGVSSGSLHMNQDTKSTPDIIRTNVFGVVNTVLPVIELMKKQGQGQIAVMSSMAGYRGLRNCPAYSASKSFVKAWGEALRGYLMKDNIKVNVICPGFVKTPLTDTNTFKMPLLMPAHKAAEIIIKGLYQNKSVIAFPAPLAFAAWIGSILPAALLSLILKCLPQKEK